MIKFQEKEFAVSKGTKAIYGLTKPFISKSKKYKWAKTLVESDKAARNTIFEAATNPGGLAKKAAETIGKNPLSVAPGYTGTTAVLTAAKKGKLTTPDSILKKTVIGKPIYAATEYTGRKVGRLMEPVVNTVYNMAKAM